VTFHPRIDAFEALPASPLPLPAESDEVLIARIAAGEQRAMRTLFDRHHLRIYRFALRLLGERELAEDVLSEVFLDVWRHAAMFEARSRASTWLIAIARFKALSWLRRRSETPLDEAAAAAIPDTSDDPETAMRKKQQGQILRDCLARLSLKHREVVDLVYYQGMTIAEVARIADIPEATVKTRMFHARKQLFDLLAAAGVDRSLS
jgi:RNA polymerase sigma-70 factor (ECF subfamily)